MTNVEQVARRVADSVSIGTQTGPSIGVQKGL
jgi:hypothetical protein